MAKITINKRKDTVKLVVKDYYGSFGIHLTIAIIDLLENCVLTQFEKEVLALLVRMDNEKLEDTRQKLSNLLYHVEVQGYDKNRNNKFRQSMHKHYGN